MAAGKVVTSDGERIGYDRLVVATGGRPSRPPVPGLDAGGHGPGHDDGGLPARHGRDHGDQHQEHECAEHRARQRADDEGGAGVAQAGGGGHVSLDSQTKVTAAVPPWTLSGVAGSSDTVIS